ncbi:inner membrane-spanning protein YciB [Sphingopyxis macrogoltabida]|uniref:Intracellular septation protein n=1 Tax=Sphingopyxis macrogoltabida TaxID=33050 RepID=A0AAC8YY11_SPHMC|nr:septation protein IspZ [Sphingopyxis macrogoltabida]ALJ12135.1 intracellular septation protein [Sphingopyxis macrogoltabida]AMU88311.1 intracellular septation protein [Sphingopyxis macrogoltabida]
MRSLLYAVGPMLFDSLGVIVFAVLLGLGVDLVIATIAGTVTAAGVVGYELARGRKVAALQWISLASVLFTAAATLFTGDPRFVMAKPTIVYLIVGSVMLRKGWLDRYILPEQLALVGDVMDRFGMIWAALMFASAGLNLVVALFFTAWWPLFIGIFPLASKFGLFAVHIAAVHFIGQARLRRRAGGELQPLAAE